MTRRKAVRRWTIGQEQARTWYAIQNFVLGFLLVALAPWLIMWLRGWK